MDEFQMAFLTHLTMLVENQQVLNLTGKSLSEYQYLLTDPNRNITKTLAFLMSQEELQGNLFLGQLIPKDPDPLVDGKQKGNPLYRLEYNTRAKNEADFVDQLSEEWLDLYLHPNPKVKEAAYELRVYLSLKDSLQFKNNSFVSLAKPQLFTRLSNGIEEDGKKVVGLKEVSDLIKEADPEKGLRVVEQFLGFPDTDFYENPQTTEPAGRLVLDFFRKWYSQPDNQKGLESWDTKYKEKLGVLRNVPGQLGMKEVHAPRSEQKPNFPLVMMDYQRPYLLEKVQGNTATYRVIDTDHLTKYQAPWAKGIKQVGTLPQLPEVVEPATQEESQVEPGQEREESGAPGGEDSLPISTQTSPIIPAQMLGNVGNGAEIRGVKAKPPVTFPVKLDQQEIPGEKGYFPVLFLNQDGTGTYLSGKEVKDPTHLNLAMAYHAANQNQMEMVEHQGKGYLVVEGFGPSRIISLATNQQMKWGDENGDRKAILALAQAQKEANQPATKTQEQFIQDLNQTTDPYDLGCGT